MVEATVMRKEKLYEMNKLTRKKIDHEVSRQLEKCGVISAPQREKKSPKKEPRSPAEP